MFVVNLNGKQYYYTLLYIAEEKVAKLIRKRYMQVLDVVERKEFQDEFACGNFAGCLEIWLKVQNRLPLTSYIPPLTIQEVNSDQDIE